MGTVSSPQGPNEGPDYLLLMCATNHKERIHIPQNYKSKKMLMVHALHYLLTDISFMETLLCLLPRLLSRLC